MSDYIKNLTELNEDSLPEAGGKGANLGVLINARLPVPPGFAVIARAYRAHLEAANLVDRINQRLSGLQEENIDLIAKASSEISSWIEQAPMPTPIQQEISNGYEELCRKVNSPDLAVAVRSSATAEDLPTASFAGQQETYLGVREKSSVLNHVKKCWASLWTPQAMSYRMSMGFDHLKVDLAVVVQAMIPSEAAGVMFTANPVTGNPDELLVSASYGLGEAVVSGLVTPDTFLLRKNGTVKEKTLGSKEEMIVMSAGGTVTKPVMPAKQRTFCIGDNELLHLAKLASLVEAHYGRPQDTEWGLYNGKIYLLQARPITTLGANAPSLLEPGEEIIYKGKKAPHMFGDFMEHAPEPMTPLDFANYCQGDHAFSRFFSKLGFRLPKNPTKPVERKSGCVAIELSAPGFSPAVLWKMPAFIKKGSKVDPIVAWKPLAEDMLAWLERTKAKERKLCNAEEAAKLLVQALDEFGLFMERRFLAVFMAGQKAEKKIDKILARVGSEALDLKASLLRALPFRTALQNQALTELAAVAMKKGKNSKEYTEELAKLLKVYGDRPAFGMIPLLSIPTWNENPDLVNELVDTLLSDPASLDWRENQRQQKQEYEKAVNRVKSALSIKASLDFDKTLAILRNSIIVREESLFLIEQMTAEMRRIALILGEFLVENGLIGEVNEVFFLFASELVPMAKGKLNMGARISKRKTAYKKVCAAHEQGVHWFFSTGSFPEFKEKKKQHAKAEPNTLYGLAASPGVTTGIVCIVRNPSEFSKMKKGDILVAPFTAPVWTPLFRLASAVVTEIGSPLSHAAIVSREYGIPAVCAVQNVTGLLKDGQRIRVDGIKGTVTIL